jgi:collagenase-like PrtC family protease
MKYFSVPSDFKHETIDGYEQLNNEYEDSKVIETYGQVTIGNSYGSGRSIDLLPSIDFIDLSNYIQYSKAKGINFNYTLNASHMCNKEFTENGVKEIKSFLKKLHTIGVRSLTIALPSLFEMIKSMDLDFKIKTSAICQITNANKASSYKKMGAERIVTDESINRDFYTLKQIREVFGDKVEIIVNAICYKDCIYRMFHYNQLAVDSVKVTSATSTQYYNHRCVAKRFEDISNIMKLSWVRPEDIRYYSKIGINHFKLQGRHNVLGGDPIKTVECYFKENFDGNLMELLDFFSPTNSFNVYVDNKKLDGFLKPFFEIEKFCKNSCTNCNYCEKYAQKAIDYQKAKDVAELTKKFYKEYDSFTELIKSKSELDTIQDGEMLDCKFNF